MNLPTAFRKTWQEVETAFKNQQINNHDLFVFVFCRAFDEEGDDIHIQYDGRNKSNAKFKPNLFVWQENEHPCVIFVGKLRFEPNRSSDIEHDIRTLAEYTNTSSVDVLASPSNEQRGTEQTMKVSPDVEIGYFVTSDFDGKTIDQVISSCGLTPQNRAKLHVATGTGSSTQAEQVQFHYHCPTQ